VSVAPGDHVLWPGLPTGPRRVPKVSWRPRTPSGNRWQGPETLPQPVAPGDMA